MEGGCFTKLCWSLPYVPMNQPSVYMWPLSLELSSRLPPHPTPLGCDRAPGWAAYVTTANPTGCFAHDTVDVSMLLCPFVSRLLPPPCVHKSVPISFPLLSGVILCGLASSARFGSYYLLIWVTRRHPLFLSFKADSPPVLSLPSWTKLAFPSPWASCTSVAHPLGPCLRLPFSALPGKRESSAAGCQWPWIPFVSPSVASKSARISGLCTKCAVGDSNTLDAGVNTHHFLKLVLIF